MTSKENRQLMCSENPGKEGILAFSKGDDPLLILACGGDCERNVHLFPFSFTVYKVFMNIGKITGTATIS